MARTDMEWVFAYGSNMDVADLGRWTREHGYGSDLVVEARPALLADHRLVWNYFSRARQGGAANVEPSAGAFVPGVALRVGGRGLAAIDDKEGHPRRYSRGAQQLKVRLLDSDEAWVCAWVYRVLPLYEEAGYVAPRRSYLDLLLRAAQEFSLPAWHQQALRSVRTAD